MNNCIGLLIPRSVIYPSLSFDLMSGLKYGLAMAGKSETTIKTESIGVGGDDKVIYSACEKLIFDGCDIIIGYMNPSSADQLAPLISSANCIFILLDAGYHYPNSMNKQANTFAISLQGALCCRVIAKTASEEGKKEFSFVGSFFDAGYRTLHPFAQALTEEGGAFNFHHITKLKRNEFTIDPLIKHLNSSSTDAIFASFCGDMLQDLMGAAATTNVFEHHPVYGTPFMGDEQWLSQSMYPGTNIKTCVTWASTLDNAANAQFKDAMAVKKQKVNLFSLLGWESALVIAQILNAEDSDAAILALEGFKYSSPRGEITIDAASHQCLAPVYEAIIRKNADTGNCLLEVVNTSPYTEEQRIKLEIDINKFNGEATSWKNAYACLES